MRTRATQIIICVCLLALSALASEAARRPNIIFILMDDMSWGALSCYGNRHVATPHLDRLASEGMRFTDAYVTPQCTPTRATLLTGQSTARHRMWHVIPWYGTPWARITEPAFVENLPRETFTLAKGLRAAGYATASIGKWHLTANEDGNYNGLSAAAAHHYGFDTVATPQTSPREFNSGDKGVNRLTDESIRFIEQNRARPFFLYLAHHSIHNIVVAPEAIVKKHLARGYPAEGLHNATYLAALEHMDAGIGRLLTRLDELKLRDDTVVMFMTDNGGIQHQFNPAPFLAGTPTPTRLTIKERLFANAPLRFGKGSLYEGGIRVPLIVRWPGVVKAQTVNRTPVQIADVLPTLLEIAGAKPPPAHTLDGASLLPLLRQSGALKPRALFWYAPLYDVRWAATPAAAIRAGDWKLIEFYGDYISPDDGQFEYAAERRVELYNLRADIGERRNLAAQQSQKTKHLLARLHAWHKAIGAEVPGLNPRYDAKRALRETKDKQEIEQ